MRSRGDRYLLLHTKINYLPLGISTLVFTLLVEDIVGPHNEVPTRVNPLQVLRRRLGSLLTWFEWIFILFSKNNEEIKGVVLPQ